MNCIEEGCIGIPRLNCGKRVGNCLRVRCKVLNKTRTTIKGNDTHLIAWTRKNAVQQIVKPSYITELGCSIMAGLYDQKE